MTSIDKSREWAEVTLIWLNEASKEYRYWDALYESTHGKTWFDIVKKYGITRDQMLLRRERALKKFIHHH